MKSYMKMAAHYLVAAERSFLSSAMVFEVELSYCLNNRSLYTRKLSKGGDLLIFDYDSFSLQWQSDTGSNKVLYLKNHEHYEVVRWIEIQAINAGIRKAYFFDLSLLVVSQKTTPQFTIRDSHNDEWIPNNTVWNQLEIAEAIADVNWEG